MNAARCIRLSLWCLAGGIAIVAVRYAAYVGLTWIQYGHAVPARDAEESDLLFDRFMPVYEVAERHHVCVAAPVEITLATASDLDLRDSVVIRVIFKSRQVILRCRWKNRGARGRLLPGQRQEVGAY